MHLNDNTVEGIVPGKCALNCGLVPPFPSREVLPTLLVVQAEVEFTVFGKNMVD